MKVALVHDYLTEYGGAERVLEAIHELWPRAPVFTSICDKNILLHSSIQSPQKEGIDWDIRGFKGCKGSEGFKRLSKAFTFFMPLVFENMDLREYDVVISDGTIWAKGVLTTPEQLHIFYCHTPPRWLYGYPGETDRRRLWYLQPILKPLDNWLRVWDFESAQRPDFIVANSQTTAARIRKFWRREAKVIYPPVNIRMDPNENNPNESEYNIWTTNSEHSDLEKFGYYLVVSRLSAYKNVGLAIEACNQLGLPLVVVGAGREEERLRKLAGPTVKFLGFIKGEELFELYKHCKVLIHSASDEDFGLAPVEAMSFGKPVIALRSGGVTETVIEGKTGIFFEEPTVESLVETLSHFNTAQYSSGDCVARAAEFSKERFRQQFRSFVEEKWRDKMARYA